MDEDVLGPRQAVLGQRYDTCTRCGAPALPQALSSQRLSGEGPPLGLVRPEGATQDAPPVLLCAACVRDVGTGEPLDIGVDPDPPAVPPYS